MSAIIYRRGPLTPSRHKAILDDAVCYYCGALFPNEVDHIIPWSRGGSDDDENLVAACWRCNGEKKDLTPDEWRELRESRGWPWPPPSWQDFVFSLAELSEDDLRCVADKIESDPEWRFSAIEAHRRGERVTP